MGHCRGHSFVVRTFSLTITLPGLRSWEGDLCRSCGSLGRDDEGQLVFCVQCGEGVHPFCISKDFVLTPDMLAHGWRFVDLACWLHVSVRLVLFPIQFSPLAFRDHTAAASASCARSAPTRTRTSCFWCADNLLLGPYPPPPRARLTPTLPFQKVCDVCEHAYHTFCLTPELPAVPQGGWRCDRWVPCGWMFTLKRLP